MMKFLSKRKWSIPIGLALVLVVGLTFISAGRALWELSLSSDIYHAIKAGSDSEVETLLQRGANPNRIGAGGLVGGTPLTWATEKSDLKIMRILIKGGADVNKRIAHEFTALMLAPTPESAQLLLDAGANPNLRNDDEQTASQYAQKIKLPKVVEVIQIAETKRKNL